MRIIFLKSLHNDFTAARVIALALLVSAMTLNPAFGQTSELETASSPTAAAPEKFDIEKHGAIVYYTSDKYLLKCDIYQPIADPKSDQLRPAVIMIHGGAWRSGSKLTMLRHARRLTRVGYVVMSINYRLAPKYPWPAQIEDCRAALNWLAMHAREYNVDTNRVGVYGYSAGAQMASILAATNEMNLTIKIKAAVAGGTPAEFSWIEPDSKVLSYWLGASKADAEEVYLDASPLTYITPDDPPFLLFHGTSDMVVPIESSNKLQAALKKQHVESKLIEVKDKGHIGTFSKISLMEDVIKFFDAHLKNLPGS